MNKRFEIPRNAMCMSDPMPFSQHWEVRVSIPLEDIDNMGAALQNGYSSFRAGDLIHVCSFDKPDWKRLKELASYRVVSVENNKIEVVQVTEIIRVAAAKEIANPLHHLKLEIRQVGRSWQVVDEKGNIIEAFVEEKQARAFLASNQPEPEAEKKAAEDDRSGYIVRRGFQGKGIVQNAAGEVVKEFRSVKEAEEWLGKKSAEAAA